MKEIIDIIIGISYGTGNINGEILGKINLIYNLYGSLVIVDDELAKRMAAQSYQGNAQIINGNIGLYEFLRQAAVICHKSNKRKALVVAHKDEIWLAEKLAGKLGLEIAPLVRELRKYPFTPDRIFGYDKDSAVWYARHRYLSMVRKIGAIIFYKIKGKI